MTAVEAKSLERPHGTGGRWVVPALGAVYLIWGSTYLGMRVAIEGIPPFLMASTRFVATGIVLLLALRVRGAPWPTRREWLMAAPVGVLMFVLGNGTVALAERHISSGVAAVVCGTMPLWAAALGRFFGERTSLREWAGLGLGFAGVGVLALGGELQADLVSTAVLMVAPITWGLGSILARRLPLAGGLMSAATQMVTGGVLMAAVSAIAGERIPQSIPARSIIAWAYLCVFGSLVAYSAYTYLLKATRPSVATSYSYVNPAIAVAIGAALGGEHIGPETVIAVVMIVGATVLVVLTRTRATSPLQPASPRGR